MKRVLLSLFFCGLLVCGLQLATAQILLVDDFDYPAGDSLQMHGWTVLRDLGAQKLFVTSPGLTFTGHIGSGIGNAVTLKPSGQDLYRGFSPIHSGPVYFSFLMNVQSTGTGDYYMNLLDSTMTNFIARAYVRDTLSGGGYRVGMKKNTEGGPVLFCNTLLNYGSTYFVVIKYVITPGSSTNDTLSLFVYPDGAIPVSEPGTPDIGPYTATSGDASTIAYAYLRQPGLAGPTVIIDAVRIAQDWTSAYLPIQLASFTCQPVTGNGVELRWSTVSELNNYGFEVQRSASRMDGYESISPLIAGHGTTLEAQSYSYTDNAGFSGAYYRLKQIDLDGTLHYSEPIQATLTTGVASEAKVPVSYGLSQNYPNPFNPSTVVSYQVPASSNVKLTVFNALGQEVSTLVNEVKPAGSYQVQFNATNLPSGLYFYRMQAGNYVETRRMLLLK